MSQFAREHPELSDQGLDYFTANTDLIDMQDGPKPGCPHCRMRSCYWASRCARRGGWRTTVTPDSGVPEEAVRAFARCFSELSSTYRALDAAAPFIRKLERQRIREALLISVAENTVSPASLVISAEFDHGRASERKAWLDALDSLEDSDD